MTIPVKALSPSGLSTWTSCQRKWAFQYVDKMWEPSGSAAMIGTFIHRVLELLYGLPPAERTEDAAKDFAREAWAETESHADFAKLGLTDQEVIEFKQQGWIGVTLIWNFEDPTKVKVLSTERKIKVKIGGVPFSGIIDRVDEGPKGVGVVDYKSGKLPFPMSMTQILLYAAALKESDGVMPATASYLFLKHKLVSVDVTEYQLNRVIEELQTAWSDIATASATGEYTAEVGPLCGWCVGLAKCPEGRAYYHDRFVNGRLKPDNPAVAKLGLIP